MVEIAVLGTVNVNRTAEAVHIQEVFEPSLSGRIFGGAGAVAFMAACLFFWQMPVENDGTQTLIVRIILCAGLMAIGIALGRSALIPRDYVTRLEFDRISQAMSVIEVSQDGVCEAKHTIPFADIKQLYAGSQTSHSSQHGGATVLYMEGEGGPRNGVLIVGSVHELEEFAPEANSLLRQPPIVQSREVQPTEAKGGFGRKGLA